MVEGNVGNQKNIIFAKPVSSSSKRKQVKTFVKNVKILAKETGFKHPHSLSVKVTYKVWFWEDSPLPPSSQKRLCNM